jgi:hypothetical protein
MKHATPKTLRVLQPILRTIRRHEKLTERTLGVFYRGSRAFLHFHEDPAGLFADIRVSADWERLPVNTASERRALVARVASALR